MPQENLLEISNNGEKPFSVKGYESIFYPGLSSKVSSGFIGNKGLGFRSIINWADEISIISNDFKLVFTEDLKNNFFGDLRYIRQSITHNNYNAISDLKKIKKLTFVYENNFLKLTSIEVEKIYNELKLETESLQNLYCR